MYSRLFPSGNKRPVELRPVVALGRAAISILCMRKLWPVLVVCLGSACGRTTERSEGRFRIPSVPRVPIASATETPAPGTTPGPTPVGSVPGATPTPTATPGSSAKSGEIDPTFHGLAGIIGQYTIQSVVEDGAGRLLFTGWQDSLAVCRLLGDGGADPAFGDGGGCAHVDVHTEGTTGYRVAIHGDRIYVAAQSWSGPQSAAFVARFTLEGTLDATFGTNGLATLPAGMADPDRLVFDGSGLVVAAWSAAGPMLARLMLAGALDPVFGDGGTVVVGKNAGPHGLVRLADGRLIVLVRDQVFAFDALGHARTDFGTGGVLTLPFVATVISPDAKGHLLAGSDDLVAVRFTTSGTILAIYPPTDPGISEDGIQRTFYVLDLWVEDDGRMLFGGINATDDVYMGIGRRLPDGTPDPAWGVGASTWYLGNAKGWSIVVLRDGRYVLAGDVEEAGSMIRVIN